MTRYGAIVADPPWRFVVRSPKGEGRSASKHYTVMGLEAIKAFPVAKIAADDCALFLWVIDPMLPHALDVVAAWGFTFKTVAFYWAKTSADGKRFPIGTGYWTRANPEQCWLCTRGAPKRLARDVRRLQLAPRREHSRKPDETLAAVERLVGGPYLELFARRRRGGWDAIGDEVAA